jgi:hypothetical protein
MSERGMGIYPTREEKYYCDYIPSLIDWFGTLPEGVQLIRGFVFRIIGPYGLGLILYLRKMMLQHEGKDSRFSKDTY